MPAFRRGKINTRTSKLNDDDNRAGFLEAAAVAVHTDRRMYTNFMFVLESYAFYESVEDFYEC